MRYVIHGVDAFMRPTSLVLNPVLFCFNDEDDGERLRLPSHADAYLRLSLEAELDLNFD